MGRLGFLAASGNPLSLQLGCARRGHVGVKPPKRAHVRYDMALKPPKWTHMLHDVAPKPLNRAHVTPQDRRKAA